MRPHWARIANAGGGNRLGAGRTAFEDARERRGHAVHVDRRPGSDPTIWADGGERDGISRVVRENLAASTPGVAMFRHDVIQSSQDVVLAQQRATSKDTLHPAPVPPTCRAV